MAQPHAHGSHGFSIRPTIGPRHGRERAGLTRWSVAGVFGAVILLVAGATAQAATQSKYAGSCTGEFTNPGNATAMPDTVVATTDLGPGEGGTLACTNFGFSIPAGSVIQGIEVTIRRAATGSPMIYSALQPIGALSTESDGYWDTSLTDETHGGPADLWSASWTAAAINQTTFGAMAMAQNLDSTLSGTAEIDAMQITVAYTPPPLTPAAPTLSDWSMILLGLSLLIVGMWQVSGRPALLWRLRRLS